MRQLQPRLLVPGHGPMGHPANLDRIDAYIQRLTSLAEQALLNGTPEPDLEQITMLDQYRSWIFPSFFTPNLKFLYQRLSKTRHNDSAAVEG